MSETAPQPGSLELHIDPTNEAELGSLLDTVTALMQHHVREHHSDSAVWPPELSEREIEILQLTAEGGTAASVALTLHLSVHTVRSHIRNARHKLKSTTVSQAVAVAIQLGLVTPTTPPAAAAELAASTEIPLLEP